MKKSIVFLFSFFVCLTLLAQTNDTNHEVFLEKCLKPTILVENENQTGTGVIVRSEKLKYTNAYLNIVFSCEHCLKSKNQKIKISEYDENGIFIKYKEINGMVFCKDPEKDISVIFFTSDTKMPVADLNFNYQPKVRSPVFFTGHGIGETARFSEGVITGATKKENSFVEYKTSIPIIFGDSGGPLYHNNKLIGIANSIKSVTVSNNVKMPAFNISTFKSLNLFNKLLIDSKLTKTNFENIDVPEIIGIDIWCKYQKEMFKD